MGSPVGNPPGCSLVPLKKHMDISVSWWIQLLTGKGLESQDHATCETQKKVSALKAIGNSDVALGRYQPKSVCCDAF